MRTRWISASTSPGAPKRDITLVGARAADIESFGRHLELLGRARAMISRRLCTITAF
jgi:hypothetical protein